MFDGKYFFTALLGDSEPHNIKVVRFDSSLPIHLGEYNPPNNINKDDNKNNELEKIEEENEEEKNKEENIDK